MCPGLRLLELAGNAEQDVFAAVGCDELHPDGQASAVHSNGRLMAGWPLVLNGGVNGTNWPARCIGAIGFSGSLTIVPSFSGNSATVGVSSRSQPSYHHDWTARRYCATADNASP